MTKRTEGLKPTYTGNITLTTSLQEVTVESTTRITKLLMDTQDGTDFYIGLESDSTATYKYGYDRNTAPVLYPYDRNFDSDTTTLFYVKGTAGSVFQYQCFYQ